MELGSVVVTLEHLEDHVWFQGDVRVRTTVRLAVKRLKDILDESRQVSEKLIQQHRARLPDPVSLKVAQSKTD